MPQRTHWKPNHKPVELLIIVVLLLLFAGTAAAEHEVDHRYDVRGVVLDQQKKPRAGVAVTILMGDQVIGGGRTDSEGFYSVRLHLHDEDIGKSLMVRAGESQATIRMQAKHGDQSTARQHQVNFVGRHFVEEKLSISSIPAWAYVAAVPLVLWAAVYVTGATRRKIRRVKSARAKKGKGKGRR